ncbi:MAG: protoporphyrinogen oxidase [Bryobacterales bacterium]|nr:protoporphyrinogen oxidase [Bryobacterales bacterium]
MAIVGGGISGLATAYYLSKRGAPFTLIEKRAHLGGVIRTLNLQGCLVEAGPDSYISVKPWARDLINELGLGGEVIGSKDDERVTFIWKAGRLIPMPDGLQFMIPTEIGPMISTPLLGFGSKLQMAIEYFRKPPTEPLPDRSVAEFVRSHFGQEVVDYLAEPLLSGIYGGDPEHLSVNAVLPRMVELETKYGSLSKGTLDARQNAVRQPPDRTPLFSTLRNGLGSLVDSLLDSVAETIEGVRGEVEAIERAGDRYRLRVNDDWIEADHVVLACEAHAAARMLNAGSQPFDPELAGLLDSIPYSSSMTLALAFDGKDLASIPQGFGFLVPKRERQQLVACTFVGNKFPFRESGDLILVRCFLGGAGGEEVVALDDESALQVVLDELREKMDITAKPVFSAVSRWPRSMAQYTVGHQDRVRRIEEKLKQHSGLHLVGNAYYGIGIPDCVRMAKEVAGRVLRS